MSAYGLSDRTLPATAHPNVNNVQYDGSGLCEALRSDPLSTCAGEFGHSVIVMDGRLCRCGGAGCLEAYVGAAALAARHAAGEHRPVPADDQLVPAVQGLLSTGGPQAARTVVAEAVDYADQGSPTSSTSSTRV